MIPFHSIVAVINFMQHFDSRSACHDLALEILKVLISGAVDKRSVSLAYSSRPKVSPLNPKPTKTSAR